MMKNPFTAPNGKALLVVGLMMAAAGAAMLAFGIHQSKSAKKRGDHVAAQSGQKDQGKIMRDCGQDALNKTHCRPKPLKPVKSTIQRDAAAERNAGYKF